MNQTSRIETLQQYIKEEPENPFNHYALALEFQKIDATAAATHFDNLLLNFPSYLPTYYHAAALFAELEEIQKAKATFESGIALAKAQKDSHAQRELQNAYQNFLFENDLD